MNTHSALFNAIVDREHDRRTSSPSVNLQSSRSASVSSPSFPASNAYWGTDHHLTSSITNARSARDHKYSPYTTSALNNSMSNVTSSSASRYGRSSDSSHPSIDLSGLIPMYNETGSPEINARGQLLDLSYETDWPTSNVTQYASFEDNKGSLWQSSTNSRLPSQQWDSSIGTTGLLAQHFHDYVPYSPPSPYSSHSSSSPSSSYSPMPSTKPAASSNPSPPRRGSASQSQPKKSCFHCHVTSTPLWRREPSTQRTLCNACGLYLQQRNKLRPQELIDADIDDDDEPQIPDSEYTGPKCSHCLTRQTSVWRRSKTGAQVCNACGVYARLRGKERPLSLRRNKIKPRTKHSR
ncbi:hypothetical protein C8R43DRAFT_1054230 [Mycena crocata]|nr:hypothetical protein C8R43DRAFT_1054230 [Mycena crocata]